MKKAIFITLLAMMFLFVSAENLSACSCMINDKPLKTQVKKAYKDSTAIFSGEVVEITGPAADEYFVTVKFRVEASWKGETDTEVTITTASQGSMCGYQFEVGKKYIVYTYGQIDELSTNNCTRTTFAGDNPDIKYLAKLKRKNKRPN